MAAPTPLRPAAMEFADDLRRTLRLTPKQIPSKYLYDALGSHLFEAICDLPWYRITRAENELLRRVARGAVGPLRDPLTLIELGCGNGEKIGLLAESLADRRGGLRVQLVDISQTALDLSERNLARFSHVWVTCHRASYAEGLRAAASERQPEGDALVLFLGSNIGNFTMPEASDFLRTIRRSLREGDGLLLGADLVKPERDLLLAYDDPLGVTAAFNRNLLVRMNGELGAHFDLGAFEHRTVWVPEHSRIEMRLVSRAAQRVRIDAAEIEVAFEAGEHIWTESSYKYAPEQIVAMGAAAGFGVHEQWIDPDARFSLTLFLAR